MKRLKIPHFKEPLIQDRIVADLYNFTNTLHKHGKMRNDTDFVAVGVQSLAKAYESIHLQTVIKNVHPRLSAPKKVWVDNVAEYFTDLDLSKVYVEDINQKTDVRFLSELRIASKLSNFSESIKGVTLLYEPHGKEKGFDILIHFENSVRKFTIMRDIKSGNINLSDLHKKKYASEIPIVKHTGEPYYIINEISSLPTINKAYVKYIKKNEDTIGQHEHYRSHYHSLNYRVNMIDNSDADDITKFQQLQEAFLNYTVKTEDKTPLRFSMYVLNIVDETQIVVPKEFSLGVKGLLEETYLLTFENTRKLVGNSMGVYSKHVNSYDEIMKSSEAYLNSIGVTTYISKNV